ncbi:MAG: HlyD family efflux transporter periplasmic adaptor subunit [Nitrospirota bacterium]
MKKKALFVLAIVGILFGIYRVAVMSRAQPTPPPLYTPAASPFRASVAASGIIEALEENVQVQPQVAGLANKIVVSRGQRVGSGDPLFHLDDRAQKAVVDRLSSEVNAAEARLAFLRNLPRPEDVVPLERAVERAEAELTDWQGRLAKLERSRNIDPGSISNDQLDQTRQQVKTQEANLGEAKARLAALKAGAWEYDIRQQEATLSAARASLAEAKQILLWHIVRAPRDGTILQINIEPGEWVNPGQSTPPMLMGITDRLQVRSDVDEVNAVEVRAGAKAVAYLRGYTDKYIPLEFERIDPYAVPKMQLTGDNRERVDVRVLQVIYSFKIPDFPVYPGQQVDVFIESAGRPKK